jgi:hypothetical protein
VIQDYSFRVMLFCCLFQGSWRASDTSIALTSRLPTSNAKARRELGWQPTYPTYREGLAALRVHDFSRDTV